MTSFIIGAAVPLIGLVVFATLASGRRRPAGPVHRTPVVFANVRVLQDDEICDAARRACERERLIAHQAERRAAHFDGLVEPHRNVARIDVTSDGDEGSHEISLRIVEDRVRLQPRRVELVDENRLWAVPPELAEIADGGDAPVGAIRSVP